MPPNNITATVGLDSPKLVGDCGEYSIGGGSSTSQRMMMLRPSAPYRLPSHPRHPRPIHMRYSKMHGLGNDFIVVRLPAVHVEELRLVSVRPGDAPTFQHPDMVLGGNGGGVLGGGGIRALSDRRRGIGCDQFIVYARRRRRERPSASVAAALAAMSTTDGGATNPKNNTPSSTLTHLREELLMWVFNGPTGEEVGMCGNALRCVALHYILGHDDVDCFEPIVTGQNQHHQDPSTSGTIACRGAGSDDLWVGGPRAELPFFERLITGISGTPTLCAELDVRVVQPNRTIRCTVDIPHSWADTAPPAASTSLTSTTNSSSSSSLRFLPDFKRHLLKSRLYAETTTSVFEEDEGATSSPSSSSTVKKPLVVTVHMGPPTPGSLAVLYPPSYPSATQHFLHKDPSTRPQDGGGMDFEGGGGGGYGKYLSRVVRSNKKANRAYLNAKLAEEAAQLSGKTSPTGKSTRSESTTTSVLQPSPPSKRVGSISDQIPSSGGGGTKVLYPSLHPESILYNPIRIQSQLRDLVVGTETFEAPSGTVGPATSVSFSFTAFGDGNSNTTTNSNHIDEDNDDAAQNSILATYTPRLHPRSRPMNAFNYRTDMFIGYIMTQLQAFSGLSDLELTVEGGGVDVGGGPAGGNGASISSSSSDDDTHATSASRHQPHQQSPVNPTFTRQQAKRAYLNLQDLLFANAVRLVTMVDFGNPHLVLLIDFAACRFKELAQLVELSGKELLQYEAKRANIKINPANTGAAAPLSVGDLRRSMYKLDASLRGHSIGGNNSTKSFGRAASMFVNSDVESQDELIKLLTQAQQDLQLELKIREKEQRDRLQRIRERYNIKNPNEPNTATTDSPNTASSIPLEFDDSFVHCIGETIEKYCPLLFPKGANVEIAFVRHEGERFYVPNPEASSASSFCSSRSGFVRTADRDASVVRMRVWERGAGITEACGSGACAVGVAAYAHNRSPMQTVVLDGGVLMIGVSASEVVGNRVNPDTGRMYGLTEAIDDDDNLMNEGDRSNPEIEGRGAPPKVTRRTLDDLLGDLHSQSSSLSSSLKEGEDDLTNTGPSTRAPQPAATTRIPTPPPTKMVAAAAGNGDDEDDDMEGDGLNANYQPFVIQNVTMAGEATFVAAGTTSLLV